MADLDRVLVLAGGMSPEHEVSLRSGRRVAEALRRLGIEVQIADAGSGLLGRLAGDSPQVVFPVLHGASGEDGSIREILELSGVPYVGARPQACRAAFAKPIAKALVAERGIAVPRGVALPKSIFHDLGAPAVLERVVDALGLPLFVKPDQGGSAFGATAVNTAQELSAALVSCFAYSDTALIEERVDGTEIAVGVLDLGEGPFALPAVEIVPDGGVYDYSARYTAGRTEFFSPARLGEEVAAAAAEAAITAHRALGLRDVSRTDLIVGADGRVRFLEVNVAPGMTDTSTLPLAVQAADLDFAVVCRELAHRALLRG
ncbi:D-alanine-D-alanine ligase [Spinactinospora alkalitolerans]|uniref:D-alanine--D-alanine ligase n=1 Tax=Spinactinospora alkalitolerans TaxID=687207 RepID=A0A852U134_9ACTN|nr:D-alanine--D-alanine ligase [Spinactinospora alkalitolerans]NYE47710.1 D-alanine-D-alanine ligase [Spinactinospora alkalitolerans]